MKKSSERMEFENKCTLYTKGTTFLKILVIYIMPIRMVLLALTVLAYLRNEFNYTISTQIFVSIISIIEFIILYFIRINSLKLNKQGYIGIIGYFSIISIYNIINNFITYPDLASLVGSVLGTAIIYIPFIVYMKKRKDLFN